MRERRRRVVRWVVAASATSVLFALVACSGAPGSDPSAPADAAAQPDGAPAGSAARWWDAPSSEPDQSAYCASLRQTQERSGQPPLDAASDPEAVGLVLQWATETAAMAPPDVAEAWPPVVALLRAVAQAGASAPPVLPDGMVVVQDMADQIRAHAASACGLTITFL